MWGEPKYSWFVSTFVDRSLISPGQDKYDLKVRERKDEPDTRVRSNTIIKKSGNDTSLY